MKQITFLSFFKRPVDLHFKEKNVYSLSNLMLSSIITQ